MLKTIYTLEASVPFQSLWNENTFYYYITWFPGVVFFKVQIVNRSIYIYIIPLSLTYVSKIADDYSIIPVVKSHLFISPNNVLKFHCFVRAMYIPLFTHYRSSESSYLLIGTLFC